jgi:molybdopterin synthase catalytic subunit
MRTLEKGFEFTLGPIVVPEAEVELGSGAVVEFRGIVRPIEQERQIDGLFYEAYEPMAQRQLNQIIDELNDGSPCYSVLFIHRIGWVPVGETSVYIRVTAAHRQEAFSFLTQLIDRMKQDVPIWKSLEPL